MFVKSFEGFLRDTDPSNVMDLFSAVIVVLFVIAAILSKAGKGDRFVANTPNLLVSLGILGTFTGIVIGLVGFDSAEIDDSIDMLLDGLKIAFITSLVGIFGSVLFKILSSTPLLASQKEKPVRLLDALQLQSKHLKALHSAIAGNEESSLAGQIKLLRNDTRDHYSEFTRELWKRLTDFADMMSKSATEQVVNALKEVITDFNTNLTEQFGENFKALDAAVQKLVEWQGNYRMQLKEMSDQYEQGVKAIVQTEASVAHISEGTERIPKTMETLKTLLEVNQHQIEELGRHLQAFKEIRDKAVEAVPELQQQVEETVTKMTGATQRLVTSINEGVNYLTDGSRAMTQEFTSMKETLGETSRQVQAEAQAIQQQVTTSIENVLTNVAERTRENVDGQINVIDEAMTREIERVITAMGTALASIAETFTNDYERLVKAMQAIVHEGRGHE